MDSALRFGLAAGRWMAGAPLATGLRDTVREVQAVGGGRLTLLATDGTAIAATCVGEPMFVIESAGAVVVASEPYDDDPRWTEVPDDTVLYADRDEVILTPLHDSQDPP